ncbi:ankyrin repeat protein [Sulfurirhabdus autotrophica]|uniref:Ankyrin repeat protein n=2 Tax=Sulfurirhabdus autotrophica TaxID=1706046 RepID=A0A4R3XYC3_9PROT|nr:ankyrin repeat protein [Sulfurirhabdus autotrophica]
MHFLRSSRLFVLTTLIVVYLAFLFGNSSFSPRDLLDAIYIRVQTDPALSSHYDWPVKLQFDAPLELPHINNYPAFARVGVRGNVHWQNNQLTVQLHEVSHAAERNLWFDCKALKEVRVGLTPMGFFGAEHSVNNPPGSWSAWQPISVERSGQRAYSTQGNWEFTIPAPLASKPWEQRLAIETKCTVKDGSVFNMTSFTSSWFLANAAHQQAYAPDPCSQTLPLREALAARCQNAVEARINSPWGRQELTHNPGKEATWLDIAIAEKMPDTIRPLVKAGIDVNSTSDDYSGDTALIYAAGNGDYKSVRELLMLGANNNQKNKIGFSPYNAAASSGYGDLAMELAEQGVNRDTNTSNAYSALSLAAYFGDRATVRRLLESGSDPDIQVGGWYNALHHAVKKDNLDLARTLLVGGANPNIGVSARRGETPLMMAAENGSIPMMKLLILMGASIDLIDQMGKNATDYAEYFRKADASDFLCKRGLEPTSIDRSPRNNETKKRANCIAPSVARPNV